MNTLIRDLRDFFVSLKLTIVLLVLGMILVFAGTWAQVDLGVWAVQQQFFRSFVAIWHIGPVFIPLPGGYLLGGFLLINLIAAHIYRFRFTWRKTGIVVAHLGLILLLLGELLVGLFQQEFNMRLDEGETKNYAESYQHVELAIVDVSDPKTDDVVVIPERMLARHDTVQYPKLPFRVLTKAYYPNSGLMMRGTPGGAPPAEEAVATTGIGLRVAAVPQPITYKQDERNTPAAIVELVGSQGSIGTWMVSAQIPTPQHFTYDGREWKIALRFQRLYEPFTITLRKFSHDVYPGTEIPKNFSSRVQLRSDDGRDNREVLIYMNNPLRYAGLTFYQAGFENNDRTSILQVVRNPSWLLPYIACAVMTLGLGIQFGIHLVAFVTRRRNLVAAVA